MTGREKSKGKWKKRLNEQRKAKKNNVTQTTKENDKGQRETK
jgi:hypothetical protein